MKDRNKKMNIAQYKVNVAFIKKNESRQKDIANH